MKAKGYDHSPSQAHRTVARGFGRIPVNDADLFAVNAGVDVDFAIAEASLIEAFISRRLFEAVDNKGMSPDDCHTLHFLSEVSQALRKASGDVA